jgi:hypothetical protein
MGIDEGGRDEVAFGIDRFCRLSGDSGRHLHDPAFGAGDVHTLPPIRKTGVPDDEIQHPAVSRRTWLPANIGRNWACSQT